MELLLSLDKRVVWCIMELRKPGETWFLFLVGVRLLLQDSQEAFLVELSGRVSADSLVGHLSPQGIENASMLSLSRK